MEKNSKSEKTEGDVFSISASTWPWKSELRKPQEGECLICSDEGEELYSFGCSHLMCKGCLAKYFQNEFDTKRRSFLEIKCPGSRCNQSAKHTDFETFAPKKTFENYLSVLKTIPTKNLEDPTLSIDDFCYKYNEKGILVHKDTGDRFHWVNQIHYDLLGDLIIPYIQQRMVSDFKMSRVDLPLEDRPSHLPSNIKSEIFFSPDWENKTRLVLLIQGSGAVRAGQWARALCINEGLETGSILGYLSECYKQILL